MYWKYFTRSLFRQRQWREFNVDNLRNHYYFTLQNTLTLSSVGLHSSAYNLLLAYYIIISS